MIAGEARLYPTPVSSRANAYLIESLGNPFAGRVRFKRSVGRGSQRTCLHPFFVDLRIRVLKRRQVWLDGQLDLDPDRLALIDGEAAQNSIQWFDFPPNRAMTNTDRTHGGERLRMDVPHGRWKTTTFVADLTRRGMIIPFVIGGPINRDAFETYVARVLVPELRPGDVARRADPQLE